MAERIAKETLLTQPTKEHYLFHADVTTKLAELSLTKSDFASAAELLKKAIETYSEHDSPYTRKVASLFFQLANSFDDNMKLSLINYYKTYNILKYVVNQQKGRSAVIK